MNNREKISKLSILLSVQKQLIILRIIEDDLSTILMEKFTI
jgi:hypothetical protein